jgi:hypothetical protein
MRTIQSNLSGRYHDRLIRSSGEEIEYGWRSNVITERCHLLLAAFMKGDMDLEGGFKAAGISMLAVGRGLAGWEKQPPPPPTGDEQQLVDPEPFTIAIPANTIVYLDDSGVPTAGPTRHIQVTVTLNPGEPPVEKGEVFPLREFALFGMFEDEYYMIDYVRHRVIHKQAGDTLTREIRLVL